MQIEIYSDVACPWCYIGHRRLSTALATFLPAGGVEAVFRPYQLDPRAPDAALPFREYMEERYGNRVEGMLEQVGAAARSEGIDIAWDKMLSVNTRTAHRLLSFVEKHHGASVQRALAEEVFALYFTRGGNVGDINHLVQTAAAIGIDGESVRAYLQSQEGVPELEAEFEHARDLGISSVPTFVINGRYSIQGAQPVSTFLQVLRDIPGNL